jgi:cell division protein ZapA
MPMVDITVNGRRHSVHCGQGEESRVKRLAAYVDRKVAELAQDKSQVGDARLMLMASLVIADELSDAYDEIQRLQAIVGADSGEGGARQEGGAESEREAAAMVERVADQLNAVAAELERP